MCSSFKSAGPEIAERIVRIESHWYRTKLQLEFLQRVWANLGEEYQTIQKQILHILNGKLTIAISKLNSVVIGDISSTSSGNPPGHQVVVVGVKRWKYAFLKESLDRIIEDLETWQKLFDPSWYLILMNSSHMIDVELKKQETSSEVERSALLSSTERLRKSLRGTDSQEGSIFLAADGLRSAYISDIPFSSSKILQRAGSSKLYIVNTIPVASQGIVGVLARDIRELARKLVHVDPIKFGLLQCYGVVREESSFTFVFRTIEGFPAPQSLRACLLAKEKSHSLSDRLEIAKNLAKSVSFVHTFGFVHKNVRPDNILLSSDTPSSLGHSFLVGFETFRADRGHSVRHGDAEWEKDLYRHPDRQGLSPEYSLMQHDIYSLGVCLLEVGMWNSFVVYPEDGTSIPTPMWGSKPGNETTIDIGSIKSDLVFVTQTILPQRMGTKYARVVETCLTCLDAGNVDFGDAREFEDQDGVLVGVRYIEKVDISGIFHYPLVADSHRCSCSLKVSRCDLLRGYLRINVWSCVVGRSQGIKKLVLQEFSLVMLCCRIARARTRCTMYIRVVALFVW